MKKEDFLAHVARELGRPRIQHTIEKPVWQNNPHHRAWQHATEEELLDAFVAQSLANHIDVTVTTKQEVGHVLQQKLDALHAKRIIVSSDEQTAHFPIREWIDNQRDVRFWEETEEPIVFSERADVGITSCTYALAESGSVVLEMNEEMGRSVSLLPRAHIALIPVSRIVPRMTQAAASIREQFHETGELASCVSFISGPSQSADIEMQQIIGVHGPVELVYIMIE